MRTALTCLRTACLLSGPTTRSWATPLDFDAPRQSYPAQRVQEDLHADIDAAKDAFLKALKEQSGSKKDLEKEISSTFTDDDDMFYDNNMFYVALNRVHSEVADQHDAPLADVPYDLVFDEKVVELSWARRTSRRRSMDSSRNTMSFLAASTYFKKGHFNYYNAATIAKQLSDNGFFAAKHSVNLNADKKLEISTQKELEDLIAKEKEAISGDKDLKKKFAEIEKLIQKNVTVRKLRPTCRTTKSC